MKKNKKTIGIAIAGLFILAMAISLFAQSSGSVELLTPANESEFPNETVVNFSGNVTSPSYDSIYNVSLVINGTVNQTNTSQDTAWNLSDFSYNNVNISLQDSSPQGVYFGRNGTRLYEVGENNDLMYQYDCSTEWDLSTCSYQNKNISVNNPTTSTYDIHFKRDGTKMYQSQGSDIYGYDCSTAWDLTTCSTNSNSLSVQGSFVTGIYFKDDGDKLYELSGSAGSYDFYEYSCSTSWDLSSCSYSSKTISAESTVSRDIFLGRNGSKLYEVDNSGTTLIHMYDCSTEWDLTSCSVKSNISSKDGTPLSISFKDDGTKMYELGAANGLIYEYNLSSLDDGVFNYSEQLNKTGKYNWTIRSCFSDGSCIEASQPWNFTIGTECEAPSSGDWVLDNVHCFISTVQSVGSTNDIIMKNSANITIEPSGVVVADRILKHTDIGRLMIDGGKLKLK